MHIIDKYQLINSKNTKNFYLIFVQGKLTMTLLVQNKICFVNCCIILLYRQSEGCLQLSIICHSSATSFTRR